MRRSYRSLIGMDWGRNLVLYLCVSRRPHHEPQHGSAAHRKPPASVDGARYQLSGFLHWGFNYYIGNDIWNRACCPHKGALLPAGDAHIVYPSPHGPWISMRYEAQRAGAEEYNLFRLLEEVHAGREEEIISPACMDFRNYTSDPAVIMKARHRLFEELECLSTD